MAYFPLETTLAGSPPSLVFDPVADGYFTVRGNVTAVFHGVISGSPPTPASEFIAYDDNVPTSNIYPVAYGGSPVVLRFTVASVFYDGTNTQVTPVEPILPIAGTYKQLVDQSPYILQYSNPASLQPTIVIPVLENNSKTSLLLPARGVLDFGQIIDQDFLYLLENFAGPVAPGSGSPALNAPVIGQLWFDTTANTIKVWDGVSWTGFGGSGSSHDGLPGSGAFLTNIANDTVTAVAVPVQQGNATTAYQQVFYNGILQREDSVGFPNTGNYYIDVNNIVFAFSIALSDEIQVYAI